MKLKFIRCKHVILTLNDDGTVQGMDHYTDRFNKPSISAAKRASRKLQEENGGLGRGSLKTVATFKELPDVDVASAA
jgi:hypothetical protein